MINTHARWSGAVSQLGGASIGGGGVPACACIRDEVATGDALLLPALYLAGCCCAAPGSPSAVSLMAFSTLSEHDGYRLYW